MATTANQWQLLVEATRHQLRQGMGDDGYREQMRAFAAVEQRQFSTGEIEYIPAVDPGDGPAAMPGREPWDYYGTDS